MEMDREYYRTFIALPARPENKLLTVMEELRHALSEERISWVQTENFHFTLRFLGDTPVDQVPVIAEALIKGIRARKFRLSLTPPDIFGSRKRPRVLFVGTEPSQELDEVHLQVETLLKNCGWPSPDQPFRPHLTLGRIRSLRDFRVFAEAINRYRETEPGTVQMDRLVYFRSVPGNGGPVYTPITTVLFS